jgi:hypothetical protein
VYPVLIVSDTSLRSESLYAALIALALLSASRLRDRPTRSRAVQLGAVLGLTALTRTEATILLLLLALPVVWQLPGRERLALAGLVAVTAALVVSPWFVRCWIAFDHPVLLSDNSGSLLAGANCHDSYHGPLLGQWSYRCSVRPPVGDEVATAADLRRAGTSYARHHPGRLLAVLAARVGRTWELFRPGQGATLEATQDGHNKSAEYLGLAAFYALIPLAAFGAFALRKRRESLLILLAPVVLVTLVSMLGYGLTRFRIPADISITILAAVGLIAAIRLVRGHQHPLREGYATA